MKDTIRGEGRWAGCPRASVDRRTGRINVLDIHTGCHTRCMHTPASDTRSTNHRFPVESIRHGVWLSYRFCLRSREVEELLCVRGILVSYEAIRTWGRNFGPPYAH
jgi:hypothetical protein